MFGLLLKHSSTTEDLIRFSQSLWWWSAQRQILNPKWFCNVQSTPQQEHIVTGQLWGSVLAYGNGWTLSTCQCSVSLQNPSTTWWWLWWVVDVKKYYSSCFIEIQHWKYVFASHWSHLSIYSPTVRAHTWASLTLLKIGEKSKSRTKNLRDL